LGGHVILWELKMIVEVAPGDLIYLPSGCITHGNIPLATETEVRYSMTWYTSGYLFQFLRAGLRKKTQWLAELPEDSKNWHGKAAERLSRGWNLFETASERWNRS